MFFFTIAIGSYDLYKFIELLILSYKKRAEKKDGVRMLAGMNFLGYPTEKVNS